MKETFFFPPDRKKPQDQFYHFLFGYIIPVLLDIKKNKSEQAHHVLQDLGPFMNDLTKELMGYTGLSFSIENIPAEHDRQDWNSRLDFAAIHASCVVENPGRAFFTKQAIKKMLGRPYHDLKRELYDIKTGIETLASVVPEPPSGLKDTEIMLIKRSGGHKYYTREERVKVSGYGSERRAITNIEQIAEDLRKTGLGVEVYEATGKSLAQQRACFAQAKTIVGLRGSDLINVIWCKPGTKVIMIQTNIKQWQAPSPILALGKISGVEIITLDDDSGKDRLDLDTKTILKSI